MGCALSALALGACIPWDRGEDEPDPADRPPLPGETAEERCEAFYAQGLLIEGRSREELARELGEPSVRSHETEPNRHVPDQVDTLWALGYEGAEVYLRTAGGRDLTERISITDDRHLRFRDPTIGTSEEALTDLLGEPHDEWADAAQYLCAPEPGPEMPVTFRLEEARVRGIAWHFYVD